MRKGPLHCNTSSPQAFSSGQNLSGFLDSLPHFLCLKANLRRVTLQQLYRKIVLGRQNCGDLTCLTLDERELQVRSSSFGCQVQEQQTSAWLFQPYCSVKHPKINPQSISTVRKMFSCSFETYVNNYLIFSVQTKLIVCSISCVQQTNKTWWVSVI